MLSFQKIMHKMPSFDSKKMIIGLRKYKYYVLLNKFSNISDIYKKK